MSAIGLDHINIKAEAAMIEAVRQFYATALGLQAGARPAFGSQGYWLYAGDKPIVHLSITADSAARRTQPDSALDHVAFACTGLAQARARLDQAGIPYRESSVPGRSQTQLFLRDPAGNGVEMNFAAG